MVEPAEVGLAVGRRVREHRRRGGQRPRPRERVGRGVDAGRERVGLEQPRHARRRADGVLLGEQVVQPGQGLRPARDHGQVANLHRVRGGRRPGRSGRRRIRTQAGIDPVDLDRRIRRPEPGIVDDHLVVVATVPAASHSRAAVTAGDLGTDVVPPRGDRLAELGDLHEPGRAVDGLVDQRRARRGGIHRQVVAHHQVPDAQRGQRGGHAGRRAAVGEAALHGVESADRGGGLQRHGVPHRPRRLGQRLERLVAGDAPDLTAERGSRDHERAGRGRRVPVLGARAVDRRVLRQPRGGLRPVIGQLLVRAHRRETPEPRRRDRHARREHDDHRHGNRPVALRMGQRAGGPLAVETAEQTREQVRDAQCERQAQQRLELVDVAQWGPRPVEEGAHRLGEPATGRTHPRRRHRHQAHRRDHEQTAARGHPPQQQTHDPGRRQDTGGQDERGLAGEIRAGGAVRRHERHPRRGPAQHLGHRRPPGGDLGGLDVVQERRRHPAEQHQRHRPPHAHRGGQRHPPRGQPRPRPARPVQRPPQDRGQARHRGRDGVDGTHQRQRERGAGPAATR